MRDSLLTASYIYPTRGDLLLQLALDILENKPFEKETLLTSALVTHENANVLYLESEEVVRRSQRLERMQLLASGYLKQLSAQKAITVLACWVIALLLIAILLIYLYHRSQVNIRRERLLNNLWNLSTHTEEKEQTGKTDGTENKNATSIAPEKEAASEASENSESSESSEDFENSENAKNSENSAASTFSVRESSPFIARFREVVERNMSNSELSVEDLAADMNLSRVQLYRKVKTITGSSPVEILRTARLNRGHQLLLTTD